MSDFDSVHPASNRCPVPDCQLPLGEDFEAARHFHEHAIRDGIESLVAALIHVRGRLAWLLRLDVAADESIHFNLSRALLDALRGDQTLTLAELSEAVGERAPVVRTALLRLIDLDLVGQPRKGNYRLRAADCPGARHE